MGLLPVNKPKEKDITPKVFFIWGGALVGKTYLARRFPSPVILSTDGNAKKVDTPSLDVFDFETFVTVLQEIESGKHNYKTIIIDLVDDIKTLLETYVCKKYEVETLADAGYGKAFSDVKMIWKKTMIRLSQLPYNVIFISHIQEVQDEANSQRTIEVPSLEQKYLNMTLGRCDLNIKCRKVGSTYLQMCVDKRDMYVETDVKDKGTLEILKTIKGVFTNETSNVGVKPVAKKLTPLKKVEKPVKDEPLEDEPLEGQMTLEEVTE